MPFHLKNQTLGGSFCEISCGSNGTLVTTSPPVSLAVTSINKGWWRLMPANLFTPKKRKWNTHEFYLSWKRRTACMIEPTDTATSFPGSFVLTQEGVVTTHFLGGKWPAWTRVFLRPLPLVGRRKTLGTRLTKINSYSVTFTRERWQLFKW